MEVELFTFEGVTVAVMKLLDSYGDAFPIPA
jgi:hypothetical protein